MAPSVTQRLTFDALSEVLTWLPAKKVVSSQLLWGRCRADTSNLFFYLAQSRHASSDSGIIVQRCDGLFQLDFLDSSSGVSPKALELLKDASRKIIASANGLIFFQSKCGDPYAIRDLWVFNPARRTAFFLPPPYTRPLSDCPYMGLAIRFVGGVDFELLCVTPTEEWTSYLECKLYSSKQRTWKELQQIYGGPRNFQLESLVLCNGILFLAPDCGPYVLQDPYIVFYDVEKESSGVLPMPEEVLLDSDPCIRIAKWGQDSMCLIQRRDASVFTVWRLNDYQQASWVKIHEVGFESVVFGIEQVRSFTVLNSKTLVFGAGNRIYAYDLEGGELRKLVAEHDGGWQPMLCPYANTLRPCGSAEGILIKCKVAPIGLFFYIFSSL